MFVELVISQSSSSVDKMLVYCLSDPKVTGPNRSANKYIASNKAHRHRHDKKHRTDKNKNIRPPKN